MSMEQLSKKSSRPQLVKVDKAFKLAQHWVNNMTKSIGDESTQVELEARPLRLGLGAAVPRNSQVMLSNDPVERKLQAKLNAEKRKVAKSTKESAGEKNVDEESDEDEHESITTREFAKKRPVSVVSSIQPKKKQK
ncbi:hypothetical protein LguiA_016993 [Lonicera macranthoides]